MNDNAEKFKTSAELRREMMELNLRLAFQEDLECEIDGLLQEMATPDPELRAAMDRADARIRRTIHQHLRRERVGHVMTVVLPRVGKAVAACLLVFFIGLTTAVATVQSVRISVLNFITEIEEKYTSIGFEDSGKSIDVPGEWTGYYYPTYIPSGFAFEKTDGVVSYYVNQDGDYLIFNEYWGKNGMNLDTENADAQLIDVEGKDMLIAKKNDWVALSWAESNHCFVLEFQGDMEVAIDVAESVILIK